MSSIGYNIVRFNCNGASVAVEFTSGFKLEAGLKPDVNVARVNYVQLGFLGGVFNQPGALEFYCSNESAPDVVIQNISILDLKPARYGQVASGEAAMVIEWEVHFGDWRFNYTAPRGGRLRYGVINPSNAQPPDSSDGSGTLPNGLSGTPVSMQTLIQNCLDAIGSSASIVGDTGGFDSPSDLQWHGSDAATELQKLLDICGMAFCPHQDGSETIETIGTGTTPSIPLGQQIATADCGALDMRAKNVIVTSAPTAAITTQTIQGPRADTWNYVVQDYDKTWKNLAEDPDILEGNTPQSLIQQNFAQLNPSSTSTLTPNPSLESQLYYCVRLNTTKYPGSLQPILHQRLEIPTSGETGEGSEDGTTDEGEGSGDTTDSSPPASGRPQIIANVALLPGDGLSAPFNGTAIDCNALLAADDTVLISDVRLGKMSGTPGSRQDYNNLFEELANGDLSIRISQEMLDSNFLPCYYVSQWQSDGAGGATNVTSGIDSSAQSILSSPPPDTIFVCRPDLQALQVDGTWINQSDLDSTAQAIAPNYLFNAEAQITETRARGFVAADISGMVSKIEYLQKTPTSIFSVNHWYRPHTSHAAHSRQREHRQHGTREAYARQHEQHQKRSGLGLSGATIPSIPHGIPSGPDLPGETVLVAIIGAETGGGRYQGSILSGPSTGNTSNNFQLQAQVNQSATDGPKPATHSGGTLVNNALVVNLNEPYVNGTHLLWGNTPEMFYAIGRMQGQTTESTPRTIVYIESWPLYPVIAKITGVYQATYGGVYYGRIAQGQFASGSSFGYGSLLSNLSSAFLPSVDNCWITNNWEQTYSTNERNSLAVGQYVWGFVAGFPQYSAITSGNTSATNVWFQVYTWFPPQCATLVHPVQNVVTTQSANSTYGINEQTMLNNLKTDVTNLQAALSNLYANMKTAGYSL